MVAWREELLEADADAEWAERNERQKRLRPVAVRVGMVRRVWSRLMQICWYTGRAAEAVDLCRMSSC